MKLLIFYADHFICTPTIKTLDQFPKIEEPVNVTEAVLAFIHVEPKDFQNQNKTITKMLKQIKWVSNKIGTRNIVLHSFAHLSSEKADPIKSYEIFETVFERLKILQDNKQGAYLMRDRKVSKNRIFIALAKWTNTMGAFKINFEKILNGSKSMMPYKKYFEKYL